MIGLSSLSALAVLRRYESRRASSYDVTGGNRDFWSIAAGETRTLLHSGKPGCVKHIWMTQNSKNPHILRAAVLRMFWDNQDHPSVECPLGDFFGLGHGMTRNFVSLPLQMGPSGGRGMNCWWPMPFNSARIELENQGLQPLDLYFYIDFEEYDAPHSGDILRFCCQWHRENPTEGFLKQRLNNENVWDIWQKNVTLDTAKNYVILETTGEGIYVGCHLDVDCFQRQGNDWYGEGDDMIEIDGEPWPPRLHGTGTEDYFCTAYCPQDEFSAPYYGVILYSGNKDWPWKGKNSLYRYHIEDPIRFTKSIRVSIEHGHGNKLSNDYSSTAYFYLRMPTAKLKPLLPMQERLPRPNEEEF